MGEDAVGRRVRGDGRLVGSGSGFEEGERVGLEAEVLRGSVRRGGIGEVVVGERDGLGGVVDCGYDYGEEFDF